MAKCLYCEGRVKKFFLIGLGEMGRICVNCNSAFSKSELYENSLKEKSEAELNSRIYK